VGRSPARREGQSQQSHQGDKDVFSPTERSSSLTWIVIVGGAMFEKLLSGLWTPSRKFLDPTPSGGIATVLMFSISILLSTTPTARLWWPPPEHLASYLPPSTSSSLSGSDPGSVPTTPFTSPCNTLSSSLGVLIALNDHPASLYQQDAAAASLQSTAPPLLLQVVRRRCSPDVLRPRPAL
jgi:hypothetical protein